jgi:hypothetical protein
MLIQSAFEGYEEDAHLRGGVERLECLVLLVGEVTFLNVEQFQDLGNHLDVAVLRHVGEALPDAWAGGHRSLLPDGDGHRHAEVV